MPHLGSLPTLTELQAYVMQLELERGFDHETMLSKCLLLGEEVGELFKAVRRMEGMGIDKSSEATELADELADVLILLCSIANRGRVNLETAFRNKEARNSTRNWEVQ